MNVLRSWGFFMYAAGVTTRRWLACAAASLIAAAGMMTGHALAAAARAAGEESAVAQGLGVASWVVAGAAAVLIDRDVPAQAVAAASVVLPLVWFATLENPLWLLGLAAMTLFALIAGLSAAVTKFACRAARRT